MATAFRERTDEQLFPHDDDGAFPETREMARVRAAFTESDELDIAAELGTTRDQVAFHVENGIKRLRGGLPASYKLVGTFGPGAEYDISTDARAATRLTHEVMKRGVAAVTASAKK